MNCDAALPATKRKKRPIDKEDVGGVGEGDPRDHHATWVMSAHVRDGVESTVVPGCGRVVCRACCVESVPK